MANHKEKIVDQRTRLIILQQKLLAVGDELDVILSETIREGEDIKYLQTLIDINHDIEQTSMYFTDAVNDIDDALKILEERK